MIWPEAPEIKDRFWTQGKSVLCPGPGGEAYHPEGKQWVLDGRLRSGMPDPTAAKTEWEKKSGSIFFLVERWKPPAAASDSTQPPDTVNLVTARVTPTVSTVLEPSQKEKGKGKGKKDSGIQHRFACRGRGSPRTRQANTGLKKNTRHHTPPKETVCLPRSGFAPNSAGKYQS